MSGAVDVRGILDRAGADADAPEGSQAWALAQVDAAVAALIEAAANVVADIRANKEPDLIALADYIKAAGGRNALKTALSKVQGKAYTLADHARVGGAK